LQAAVDAACNRKQNCSWWCDCDELWDRYSNCHACAVARDTINKQCFRGGNQTHRDQLERAIRNAADCWEKYWHKCLMNRV
jgi:type VI secretion system secreted protein VgrG